MFTGIITDIGSITSINKKATNLELIISSHYHGGSIEIGGSIACSGICLTVTSMGESWFSADISEETLLCTTASTWEVGNKINLERSLKVGDELGGHFVTGHVDDTALLKEINENRFSFLVPDRLSCFIAEKGSVTLDGVSLTVNSVTNNTFSVMVIPHTLKNTTLGCLNVNDKVNLEIDILARYVNKSI